MNTFDPFDLLAALSPVPELDESLPTDEALLASIVRGETPEVLHGRRSVRRGRHLRLIGGTGLCVVLIAAVAAFNFTRRAEPVVMPDSVACYSDPVETPRSKVVAPISNDAIEICRGVWRNGGFAEVGVTGSPEQLAGCVDDQHVLIVVPGGMSTCERLGYPVWSGKISDNGKLVIAIQDWVAEHVAQRCVSMMEMPALVTQLQAQLELDDWSIVVYQSWWHGPGVRRCGWIQPYGATKELAVMEANTKAFGPPTVEEP